MSTLSQSTQENTIITSFSGKDGLKALFHLVASKPHTITDIFPRPILISLKDIEELHKQIAEKLNHYHLYGAEFSAIIRYENKRFEEYGSWDTFYNRSWSIPEITESLVLKWQFLIKFPNECGPSNHAIVIRLSSTPKPFEVMQAVFSKDPDELDSRVPSTRLSGISRCQRTEPHLLQDGGRS